MIELELGAPPPAKEAEAEAPPPEKEAAKPAATPAAPATPAATPAAPAVVESLTCDLKCAPKVFVAVASGALHPSVALHRGLVQTSTAAALLRIKDAALWEREAYAASAAERLRTPSPSASPAADRGGGDGAASGHRRVPSGGKEHPGRTKEEEEAIRQYKLEVKRMEERERANPGGWVGALTVMSSVGAEATRQGMWRAVGFLSGGRAKSPPPPGGLPEESSKEPGLEGTALLDALGGDDELFNGFSFMPQAFLGCSWSGRVHVSVGHDGGEYLMTLAVSPDGAKVHKGHTSKAPMLCVSARRDVLLDVVAGRLDATRAVVTGKIWVSDLGKLVVFKSAFRFKRAVFEAFLSAQRARAASVAPPGADSWRARRLAHPADASFAAELAEIGDKPLTDALLFAYYCFCGSDWAGDVAFALAKAGAADGDEPELTVTFALSGASLALSCRRGRTVKKVACTVACERQVLLDVLSGRFELTAALVSGQMSADNFTAMMAFKRAFKFDRGAYDEFVELQAKEGAAAVNFGRPPSAPPGGYAIADPPGGAEAAAAEAAAADLRRWRSCHRRH